MGRSPRKTAASDAPVRIKKYANRRLYNTETSAYVTLDDLATMVRDERDFEVVDAKSGEDLTHAVLTQIILDQESRGQNLLPVNFLRQLIRFYGHNLEQIVPSYLEISMETLAREQERFHKQIEAAVTEPPMTPAAMLEAFQRQAMQNMEMFERAVNMFTAFPAGAASEPGEEKTADGDASAKGAATATSAGAAPGTTGPQTAGGQLNGTHGAAAAVNGKGRTAAPRPLVDAKAGGDGSEISELREQLAAIQAKLDTLGR